MTLRTRLILLSTLFLTLTVVAVTSMSLLTLQRETRNTVHEELNAQVRLLLFEVGTVGIPLPALSTGLSADDGMPAAQIYRDDQLIWTGGNNDRLVPQPLDARFLGGTEGERSCTCAQWNVYSVRQGSWVVQVGRPSSALHLMIRRYLGSAALINVFCVLVFGVLMVRSMRRIMRPLTALAERLRRLDATDPIPCLREPGEVGVLARALNDSLRDLRTVRTMETQFLADASHELRTPVTALLVVLEHATKRSRSEQEVRQALDQALRSATHLKRLTTDLLTLTKSRSAPAQLNLDLLDLANEVVDRLMPLACERMLELDIDGEATLFHGDPVLISRMIENLVANAIKFTDAGGVRVRVHPVREHAELSVTDDGVGFPAEQLRELQQPFRRGNAERREGFGLGLAVVKSVAEAHGGDLEVESRIGHGARVTVRLPLRCLKGA